MLLHLSYDQKFIDNVVTQFEEVSGGKNIYLILSDNKDLKLKHISVKPGVNIIVQPKKGFNIIKFLSENRNVTGILFHSLSPARARMLLEIKKKEKIKIGWMCWGTEIYSNSLIVNYPIIQPLTKSILRKSKRNLRATVISSAKDFAYYLKEGFVSAEKMMKKAILRVDYCMPVFKEDYILFKKLLPGCNAKYLPFNYGYLNLFLGNLPVAEVDGEDILIGNSASSYNNHVDAFVKIKDFPGILRHKIIVPLSYGEVAYQKNVMKIGKELFADNFIGLESFIKLEEYIRLISKCRYVIMNNNRQQGMGNIIVMIWLGAKVFINKTTTTWAFFNRIGVKVYAIEEDLNEKAFVPLSSEIINSNKSAIEKEYSRDIVLKRTKDVYDHLSG